VQHHHAHIASVVAEHGLVEPVIGVAFDGTGYGGGNIWGGEILICEGAGFKRFSHLAYVDMPGGDLASVDASLPASAYFSDFETEITRALPKHKSSSVGRLFDAVSYALGICEKNEYEGQCAVALENAAAHDPLALAFHDRIISLIGEQCERAREETSIKTVCLSGGVFQNSIILRGAFELLRAAGFEVYTNEKVPVNDGGIPLGQAWVAARNA
jgi:hydrogenase maturation protein HypF